MELSNTSLLLIAALIGVLLAAKLWLRRFVWWLFSFEDDVQEILARKKSSEVRLGRITEQLAPLLEDFPVDVESTGSTLVFMGGPIDYVHFDPEEGITFIEVKSGGARLSSVQRAIKQQIAAGNVFWEEFRVRP